MDGYKARSKHFSAGSSVLESAFSLFFHFAVSKRYASPVSRAAPSERDWLREDKGKFRVPTGQEMVRKKKKFKVREFYFESGKIDILEEKSGKLK